MIKFRAVNIYPGNVDEILSRVNEIASEYQIVINRASDGRDYMTVKVERAEDGSPERDAELAGKIRERIKKELMVTAGIEIVDYGALPRSERKEQASF